MKCPYCKILIGSDSEQICQNCGCKFTIAVNGKIEIIQKPYAYKIIYFSMIFINTALLIFLMSGQLSYTTGKILFKIIISSFFVILLLLALQAIHHGILHIPDGFGRTVNGFWYECNGAEKIVYIIIVTLFISLSSYMLFIIPGL